MVNGVLDLGDMRTHVTPRLTFSPGAMAESLASEVRSPNQHMMLLLIWLMMESPIGSFHHLHHMVHMDADKAGCIFSYTFDEYNDGGTMSVLVPQNANIHTLLLGINPNGNTEPLTSQWADTFTKFLHTIGPQLWFLSPPTN